MPVFNVLFFVGVAGVPFLGCWLWWFLVEND